MPNPIPIPIPILKTDPSSRFEDSREDRFLKRGVRKATP
jgi:hypothetical protein